MRIVSKKIRAFLSDRRGNTAIMLGLCILPIGILAGAAIDFSRAESNSVTLGTNLDSATLATARYVIDNPDVSKADVKTFASEYLVQAFGPTETKTLDNIVVDYVPNESVTVSAESTIQSTMLGLASIKTLKSKKLAAASFGAPTGLRAILVLDNSESMKGEKMTALQTAAENFVNDLVVDGVSDSYIGVVPFSHYVNVGTDHEHEPWMNAPDDDTRSWNACWVDGSASRDAGCTEESYACTKTSDGVEYSSTCTKWVCPENVDTVETCNNVKRDYEWCGAVIQRPPPFHLIDGNYGISPIDGYLSEKGSNWECNTPILPMSNKKDDVLDYIDDLQARGDTYIAPGLMWGYRVLSPEAPFTEMNGKDISSSAIVLMSDGMNSRSYKNWLTGSDHYGNDKGAADDVTEDTCEFIKSKDVQIYAIAFQVDDNATETMLKNCATSYAHYYDADSFDDLNQAFSSVANSFREVALSK